MKLAYPQFSSLLWHYPQRAPFLWSEIFESDGDVTVEIGCGQGEYINDIARAHPEQNFVGLEIIWDRVGKTLNRIQPKNYRIPPCSNVRVLCCDAWIAFERLIAPRSVNRLVSLFPCPWPKSKHIKNRLFSNAFLLLLNSRLKDGGTFLFVTDAEYFYDWVLEESVGTGFSLSTDKIDAQFQTKFEKKWLKQGQKKFFKVEFKKVEHKEVLVKENQDMKSFRLDSFDADAFHWEDHKEEAIIILKDVLFDQKREMAQFHLIVQEEHLLQHIRVVVFKKDDYWRVCMAEGQDFYPTQGVNKAIELVYQAAL